MWVWASRILQKLSLFIPRFGGWFASLKAMGGNSSFTMLGEVALEDRLGGTAYTVRGSLRFGF